MGNDTSTEKGKCALKIKRSSQPSIGKTRMAGGRGRPQQNGGSLRMMTTARPMADGRCFMDASASGEQSPISGDSTKSPGSQDFHCGGEEDGSSTPSHPPVNGNCVTRHSPPSNKNAAVGLVGVAIGSHAAVGSPGYVKKKKRTSKQHFIPNSAQLPSHFPRPNPSQLQLHSTPGMDFIEGKLRSQNLLERSIGGGAESPTTFTSPVEDYVDSPRSVRMANEPRKNSLGERSLMSVATAYSDGRKRSRSLCAQQLQANCQAVASEMKQQQPSRQGRRASSAIMPSLARLRIQQCFKNARPNVGQQILRRASSLRTEIKAFVNCLGEEKFNQLACDIYQFVTESVANIDAPDKISTLSRTFGQKHAQLSNYGFRPEFFSLFADATIAECVRLDGGAHKRCETLLAWSQLMQYMFSNVRDGYYAEIRRQRRSSLPQHKILMKQGSTDMRNTSFDMDM